MKPSKKLLFHAAEAKIYRVNGKIIKNRIPKGYRLPVLDKKIRRQRTRKEARLLQKAASLIPVPKMLSLSEQHSTIEMEYVTGKKLADSLDFLPPKEAHALCLQLGKYIAAIHDAGIIHGDLTTSNLILKEVDQQETLIPYIYFIDFGLGFESRKIEDRAVDIHLMKEALEAKHPARAHEYMEAILTGYKTSKKSKETLARLAIVEKRGRYKQQF